MLYRVDDFVLPWESAWGLVEAESAEEAVRIVLTLTVKDAEEAGEPLGEQELDEFLQQGTLHVSPATENDEVENEDNPISTRAELNGEELLTFDLSYVTFHDESIRLPGGEPAFL